MAYESSRDYVKALVDGCCGEAFPHDPEFLSVFMFDRLNPHDYEEEFNCLMGVYVGMIKGIRKFHQDDLVRAVKEKSVANYILSLYSGNVRSYYSDWFRKNINRFQDAE